MKEGSELGTATGGSAETVACALGPLEAALRVHLTRTGSAGTRSTGGLEVLSVRLPRAADMNEL